MNILALVGVVFALAGTVFGIMEAVVKEFVNVFLPLDSSSDPELSCRIGNLGVFTSSYDPTCLGPEILAESHLPVKTFTSSTTKFKLLFPAQTNFIKDLLPITPALIDQFAAAAPPGTLDPAVIEDLQDKLAAATPDFTNCADYMSSLQTGQLVLFNTFDILLTGALVELAVTPVLVNVSNNLGLALPAIRAPVAQNAIAGVTKAVLTLSGTALSALCGFTTDTVLVSADNVTCAQTALGATAAGLSGHNVTAGLLSNLAGLIDTSCFTVTGCVLGNPTNLKFSLTADVVGAIDANSLCAFMPAAAGPCTSIAGLAAILSGIVTDLISINPLFGANDDLVQAAQALGLIGETGFYFSEQLLNDDDNTILTELNQTIPNNLKLDFYPDSFAAPDFLACKVQSLAADLLAGQTGEPRVSGVPNVIGGENCTFDGFFTAASALLAATDPNNEFAGLLPQLQFLYQNCGLLETDPAKCKNFFPSFFVDADYSLGLDLSQFSGTGDAIFAQAVGQCEDDNIDISKMKTAETLVPIAIVCIGLSVVAGALAAFTEHKIATIAACVLSLAGGVLNLAALLDVKSAPVYKLVGQPPVFLSPLYKAGITQIYGLIFIACGVIAAILFGVSLLPCLKKEGDDTKEGKLTAA